MGGVPFKPWQICCTKYIAFRQYNRNKPHKYGVLLKSLNNAHFPYTYKALPYPTKRTAGDGPLCISSTADYIKNLVIRTKEQVRLDGRNISMEMLQLRR